MDLYIGGISQGKLEYVLKKYRLNKNSNVICDGASCTINEIFQKPVVNHFHEYIKRLLAEDEDVMEFLDVFIEQNSNAIVICNEVGYGIVPMVKEDRIFRETVGRSCCKLASFAKHVERIVCGMGITIK